HRLQPAPLLSCPCHQLPPNFSLRPLLSDAGQRSPAWCTVSPVPPACAALSARAGAPAATMPQLSSGGEEDLGASDEMISFKDEGEQEEKIQENAFTERDLADLKSSLVNESEAHPEAVRRAQDAHRGYQEKLADHMDDVFVSLNQEWNNQRKSIIETYAPLLDLSPTPGFGYKYEETDLQFNFEVYNRSTKKCQKVGSHSIAGLCDRGAFWEKRSLPKLEDRWVQPGPAASKASPNQGFKLQEANLHIPGAFWEKRSLPKLEDRWVQPGPAASKASPNQRIFACRTLLQESLAE
ncbi:unnamed protein product, partial [Ranitomeya imitator]